MTTKTVEAAILHAQDVYGEWKDLGFEEWREDHTRYAIIDPIIRALGWEICDPKECHPEYWRYRDDERGRVDYALFLNRSLRRIGNGTVAPDMIIEAKNPAVNLESCVEQLLLYARASPAMRKGVAALTNGKEWWIYQAVSRGGLRSNPTERVPILDCESGESAHILFGWLGRAQLKERITGET